MDFMSTVIDRVVTERDWQEDFSHENGNYVCQCHHCWHMFVGHKRRTSCKICSTCTCDVETETPTNGVKMGLILNDKCPIHGEQSLNSIKSIASEIEILRIKVQLAEKFGMKFGVM